MTIGTIVCVDDQAEVRRLLADVFRARGGNVVGFDNGEDAIAWLNTNDADLAVLDLDLGAGRRSGIEICRAIHGKLPELPIIASSGYSDDPVMAGPAEFGFSASLRKPFRLNELGDLLARLVPR